MNATGQVVGNSTTVGDAEGHGSNVASTPVPEGGHSALAAKISDLHLSAGITNSLIAKLNAAIASIERSNTGTAINQLSAAENEIQAQAGKKISSSDAAYLIAEIQKIIQKLQNGTC